MVNKLILNRNNRTHVLMNKNEKVLEFQRPLTDLEDIKITKIYRKDLLPYRMKYNTESLDLWLKERAIPTNREHIQNVLNAIGVEVYNHLDLLEVNHGCSLNDSYWIKNNIEDLNYKAETFEQVSLYRGFKESLGLITFFGGNSSLGRRLKTPETTAQGALGKAWRIIDGNIKLFKAGTTGFANAGLEPYMEVIASKIAEIINLNHVSYKLDYWDNKVCCVSDLFTTENTGYLPMAEYLNAELGSNVRWTYYKVSKLLSDNFMSKINDMIVFDYIIENCDRHFNNFGFIVDNNTREIKGIAPLFDHGMSLHWNKIPSIDTYSSNISNKGTFDALNSDIAKEIIKKNPQRYKHWAKEIMLNIKEIENKINLLNDIERRKWVKQLILDRCSEISRL